MASRSNRDEASWEMGQRLVETARRYAADRALAFSFEHTESMVVVRPDADRAVADVWFYSTAAKPKLQIGIDADGKAVGHAILIPTPK